MAYTFSTDQLSIINSRNQNILVSAAAGSGKTSVLTERIVGRVNDPVHPIDIDRMLVVTFTNAAAREMKERIGSRLSDLVAENPENAHLQKQTTLIHSANITTIDSFCLFLVRNHFSKIDVDPSFRVADENEMKLLKEDVLKKILEDAYESKDEDFYHTIDCYSKKDRDDSLEASILKLYTYACSYPWPKKWLEKRKKDYAYESLEELENSELLLKIKKEIEEKLTEMKKMAEATLEVCLDADGPVTYEENIRSDIEMFENLIAMSSASYDSLRDVVMMSSFFALSRAKCECSQESKDYVKALRESYKKQFSNLKEAFFLQTLEQYYEDIKGAGKVVNRLIDLVIEFLDKFEAEKRNRGVIDFTDMEHMAIDILIEDYREDGSYDITDVAKGYRDFFEEVMVDEYQDSNLVQELIIQSVSRECEEGSNRFMVGDVKQSIYRFRLARPEIFKEKTKKYQKDEDAFFRLITLKANYRSRRAVIESVNKVFEHAMVPEYGGILYTEDERLNKGADYPEDTKENTSEVLLVEKSGKSGEARDTEMDAISLRIKELVGNFDIVNVKEKTTRKAEYRDIVLLFRSPTKWLSSVKDSFEKFGIPYHLEGVGTFYGATEIQEIINFLRVLNNPLDDVSVYATMTSHFGGFSDEECARIKGLSAGSDRFFYEKVRTYSENHIEDEKVNSFLALIERFRRLSTVLAIPELISRIFEETGYKKLVAAMPNGKQRLANVDMLITKARSFAKTSFYGLFHFLRYIELIRRVDIDEGEANTFDESANVVRVMSIHKSKGLEFPICIVAGIDEAFNDKDTREEFVTDIDEGVGASFIDPERRVKRPTLVKSSIIEKIRRDNIGEEIRILYVAMTRAKEKLILAGLDENPEAWFEKDVKTGFDSYLSLMGEAIHSSIGTHFVKRIIKADDIDEGVFSADLDMSLIHMELENGVKGANPDLVKLINEKFSFEYPHKGLEKLYTKTTVSNLKMAAIEKEELEAAHPFEENEQREYVPIFAGGKEEVKGTDRGTAYHNLLQLLEFKDIENTKDEKALYANLNAQMKRMVEKLEMPAEDLEKIFKGKIVSFLMSDTAREMIEADKNGNLYKEQPFVIGVPASDIEEEFPEDETLLVQGVIDVYYIKDGEVTVLDYKTDRIETGEALVARYKKQLDYYAEAIKQLTGLPVTKKLIYSFGLNDTFVVK